MALSDLSIGMHALLNNYAAANDPVHLRSSPAEIMALAAQGGAEIVRLPLDLSTVGPNGAPEWAIDGVAVWLTEAARYGIEVIMEPGQTPPDLSANGTPQGHPGNADDLTGLANRFALFVEQIYDAVPGSENTIVGWEVGNEPNLSYDYQPGYTVEDLANNRFYSVSIENATWYADYLHATKQAIAGLSLGFDVPVIGAGIAHNDAAYIEALFTRLESLNATVDGFSVHPYTVYDYLYQDPASGRPTDWVADPVDGSSSWDYYYSFQGALGTFQAAMNEAGFGTADLWITEFGVPSYLGYRNAGADGERDQARWFAEAFGVFDSFDAPNLQGIVAHQVLDTQTSEYNDGFNAYDGNPFNDGDVNVAEDSFGLFEERDGVIVQKDAGILFQAIVEGQDYDSHRIVSVASAPVIDVSGRPSNGIGLTDGFIVLAHQGNDRIIGSIFDDSLFGGTGNDTIFSGAGNDRVYGGDGRDVIQAEGGDDDVYGGAGNDNLFVGPGNNRVDGGAGWDTLAVDGVSTDYSLTGDGTRLTLTHLPSGDTTGGLNVERVLFAGDNVSRILAGADSGRGGALPGASGPEGYGRVRVAVDGLGSIFVIEPGPNGETATYLAIAGEPVTLASDPTLYPIQAERGSDGTLAVLWTVQGGGFEIWSIAPGGEKRAETAFQAASLAEAEEVLDAVVQGEIAVGRFGTLVDDAGAISIVQDDAGHFLLRRNGLGDVTTEAGATLIRESDVLIRDPSGPVKPDAYGGWNPVRAEAGENGGFSVIAYNDDIKEGALWTVDAGGLFQSSSAALDLVALRALEEQFGDIDGDGRIGQVATPIETVADASLLRDSIGRYLIRTDDPQSPPLADGLLTEVLPTDIVLIYGGAPLLQNAFGGTWNLIQIETVEAAAPPLPGSPIPIRDGSIGLIQDSATGRIDAWLSDLNGINYGSFELSPAEIKTAESFFGIDLDGDGSLGHYAESVEANGSVELLYDTYGRFLIRDTEPGSPTGGSSRLTLNADETVLTLGGAPVEANMFGGFNPIQVERSPDSDGGYEVLIFNESTGQFGDWQFDENGMFTGSRNVDLTDVLEKEPFFGTDINGDNIQGAPVSLVSTGPGSQPETTPGLFYDALADRYLIRAGLNGTATDNGRTIIDPAFLEVQYLGDPVGNATFDDTWRPILVQNKPTGFELVMRNPAGGDTQLWTLGPDGRFAGSSGNLAAPAVKGLEANFEADIDGDGEIGNAVATLHINSGDTVRLLSDSFGSLFIRPSDATPLDGATLNDADIPILAIAGNPLMQSGIAGFRPIAAARADPDSQDGGYRLLLKQDGANGFALWELNGDGSYRTSSLAEPDTLFELERTFGLDLNDDGVEGPFDLLLEDNGETELRQNEAGLYVLDAVGERIPVTYLNDALHADTFEPDYRFVEAESRSGLGDPGYWVLLEGQGDRSDQVWALDETGAFEDVFVLDATGNDTVNYFEGLFRRDFDGDGLIGSGLDPDLLV
ncbi:MAG: hypothetical protein AAGF59_10250 [Pseudomonadota bacterium]